MKVEKIIIHKELLDIPENTRTMHYAIREPIMTEFDVVKEEVFEVRQWKDNFGDIDEIRTINYLVKVNDFKLFDVLAKIEQTDVENMEHRWKGEFMMWKAPIIRQQVRDDIKKLKWWKRLFNKF